MRVSADVEFNLCTCVQHLLNRVELSFDLGPGYDLGEIDLWSKSRKTRPQIIIIWQTFLFFSPLPPPQHNFMTSIHKTEPKDWVSRIASSTLVVLCDLGTCRRITVHGGWVTKSGPCWWWGAVRSGVTGGGTNTCPQHLPPEPEPEPQPPARQRARQTSVLAYSGVRSLLYLLTRTLTEDTVVVLVPLNSPQHPSTGSAVESEILGWSFPLAFKYDLLATCLINYLVTEKTVSDKNEI